MNELFEKSFVILGEEVSTSFSNTPTKCEELSRTEVKAIGKVTNIDETRTLLRAEVNVRNSYALELFGAKWCKTVT